MAFQLSKLLLEARLTAAAHAAYILVDEVYLDFDPEARPSAVLRDPRVVVTNSLTKQSVVDHPMSLMHTDHPSDEDSLRGEVTVLTPLVMNDIKLHIYDLIAHDTLMQLPWGCVCEIGKCFATAFRVSLPRMSSRRD